MRVESLGRDGSDAAKVAGQVKGREEGTSGALHSAVSAGTVGNRAVRLSEGVRSGNAGNDSSCDQATLLLSCTAETNTTLVEGSEEGEGGGDLVGVPSGVEQAAAVGCSQNVDGTGSKVMLPHPDSTSQSCGEGKVTQLCETTAEEMDCESAGVKEEEEEEENDLPNEEGETTELEKKADTAEIPVGIAERAAGVGTTTTTVGQCDLVEGGGESLSRQTDEPCPATFIVQQDCAVVSTSSESPAADESTATRETTLPTDTGDIVVSKQSDGGVLLGSCPESGPPLVKSGGLESESEGCGNVERCGRAAERDVAASLCVESDVDSDCLVADGGSKRRSLRSRQKSCTLAGESAEGDKDGERRGESEEMESRLEAGGNDGEELADGGMMREDTVGRGREEEEETGDDASSRRASAMSWSSRRYGEKLGRESSSDAEKTDREKRLSKSEPECGPEKKEYPLRRRKSAGASSARDARGSFGAQTDVKKEKKSVGQEGSCDSAGPSACMTDGAVCSAEADDKFPLEELTETESSLPDQSLVSSSTSERLKSGPREEVCENKTDCVSGSESVGVVEQDADSADCVIVGVESGCAGGRVTSGHAFGPVVSDGSTDQLKCAGGGGEGRKEEGEEENAEQMNFSDVLRTEEEGEAKSEKLHDKIVEKIKAESLARSSPGEEGPLKCPTCKRLYRTRESYECHVRDCDFEVSTSDEDEKPTVKELRSSRRYRALQEEQQQRQQSRIVDLTTQQIRSDKSSATSSPLNEPLSIIITDEFKEEKLSPSSRDLSDSGSVQSQDSKRSLRRSTMTQRNVAPAHLGKIRHRDSKSTLSPDDASTCSSLLSPRGSTAGGHLEEKTSPKETMLEAVGLVSRRSLELSPHSEVEDSVASRTRTMKLQPRISPSSMAVMPRREKRSPALAASCGSGRPSILAGGLPKEGSGSLSSSGAKVKTVAIVSPRALQEVELESVKPKRQRQKRVWWVEQSESEGEEREEEAEEERAESGDEGGVARRTRRSRQRLLSTEGVPEHKRVARTSSAGSVGEEKDDATTVVANSIADVSGGDGDVMKDDRVVDVSETVTRSNVASAAGSGKDRSPSSATTNKDAAEDNKDEVDAVVPKSQAAVPLSLREDSDSASGDEDDDDQLSGATSLRRSRRPSNRTSKLNEYLAVLKNKDDVNKLCKDGAIDSDSKPSASPEKRGRGRPRIYPEKERPKLPETPPAGKKRGRGRSRRSDCEKMTQKSVRGGSGRDETDSPSSPGSKPSKDELQRMSGGSESPETVRVMTASDPHHHHYDHEQKSPGAVEQGGCARGGRGRKSSGANADVKREGVDEEDGRESGNEAAAGRRRTRSQKREAAVSPGRGKSCAVPTNKRSDSFPTGKQKPNVCGGEIESEEGSGSGDVKDEVEMLKQPGDEGNEDGVTHMEWSDTAGKESEGMENGDVRTGGVEDMLDSNLPLSTPDSVKTDDPGLAESGVPKSLTNAVKSAGHKLRIVIRSPNVQAAQKIGELLKKTAMNVQPNMSSVSLHTAAEMTKTESSLQSGGSSLGGQSGGGGVTEPNICAESSGAASLKDHRESGGGLESLADAAAETAEVAGSKGSSPLASGSVSPESFSAAYDIQSDDFSSETSNDAEDFLSAVGENNCSTTSQLREKSGGGGGLERRVGGSGPVSVSTQCDKSSGPSNVAENLSFSRVGEDGDFSQRSEQRAMTAVPARGVAEPTAGHKEADNDEDDDDDVVIVKAVGLPSVQAMRSKWSRLPISSSFTTVQPSHHTPSRPARGAVIPVNSQSVSPRQRQISPRTPQLPPPPQILTKSSPLGGQTSVGPNPSSHTTTTLTGLCLPQPPTSSPQSQFIISKMATGGYIVQQSSPQQQQQQQQEQQQNQQQQQQHRAAERPTSFHPGVAVSGASYGVLEASLSGVRDLTESLYQVREAQLRHRAVSQEIRKLNLTRFSSSCPSLNEPFKSVALSPIDEGDHHKSMHDLVEEVGRGSPRAGHSPGTHSPRAGHSAGSPYSASPRTQSPRPEGAVDQAIRICVNGVTVDSSEDFPAKAKAKAKASSASSAAPRAQSQDPAGPPHRKYSRLRDGKDQMDILNRRGSWCPERSDAVRSNFPFDRKDQQTRVMMLAMTGKSLSLTSLDADEDSEDEDVLEAESRASDEVGASIRAIGVPRPGKTAPAVVEDREADARSISPVDSTSSSPTGREMPDPGLLVQSKIGGDLSLSSHNARSLSDLTSTESPKRFDNESSLCSSPGGPKPSSQRFEEAGGLAVPHSNMTKSLSTPSIPQATEASGDRAKGIRERREGKHNDEDYQRFLEDYDAQFRRQKEIEEEEEDENASPNDKKVEISWKDFISEEQSPNDSDEKSSKAGRKEEKRRKPSVFSRFQSSYRTKKNKEKDSKSKDRHRFVAISFSNATACDACHKPMANKAALRCENCLVNVHEHNCKDQIPQCDKNRNKALQRDGSSHGPHGTSQSAQVALLERQSASVPGTSLRPSHSFKDKRSSSAPVKPQPNQQLSAPPQLSHRHSLPTSSLFGSPPSSSSSGSFFQWPVNSPVGRFSVLDKAISEESESDTVSVSTMDLAQSNMTDTISESMESLDAVVPTEVSCLEDEPDLQLGIDEPEAWSITVDRKTLKKLNTKDIKRQDTIWELIQTEKQYVKRLKIMQKIFSQSMLEDMNFTVEQVDRLFPRLDDLVELHANFLRQLLARQAKNDDRSIDEIGDVLVGQFKDGTADKMKMVYGVFCSKHTEAMQLYKEFLKVDRKFQNFAKRCTNLPVCEKRDISDFILGVTVRLSKYPILLEAILKSTKDKKDRENLSHALLMSKDVVQHVDEKVAAYEKLIDIQSKLDSRAVTYKGKKFKRQDLTADSRELLHAGKIGWKSARGRVYDVLAVVLTDLIVFLQKNEQKYTFLLQDNKSCVIPLYRLLVREKRDARDSLGIYMISQNRATPEMYELVCKTKGEREDWLRLLEEAIRASPPDVDPMLWPDQNSGSASAPLTANNEEEKRKKEEHANQIKLIIDQLHKKDEDIRECCEEKNKLMTTLMEMSAPRKEPGSRPNSQEIVCVNESIEIVQAAMEEASKLTTFLQVSGTALSRSVSSVGEHHSSSFVATPVPKRAETFAGFDSSHESPKMNAVKQRFALSGEEEDQEQLASMLSLDQQEADNSFSEATDGAPVFKEPHPVEGPASSSSPHALSSQSPLQHSSNAHLWEEQVSSDRSSDRGSLGELSAASVSSLIPSPANQEQMTSISHLVQYLNALMNLTSKQNTKVESLRAELAEAKEEIAKLSADMHGRRSVYRHDQLEELRNLQENISRERQEWERVKLQDRSQLQQEREQLERDRHELEHEKVELRTRKEDLKRQREALQRQIDMMREQGLLGSGSFVEQNVNEIDLDNVEGGDPSQQRPIVHRRSASADFYNTVTVADSENSGQNLGTGEPPNRGLTRHPRLSVGNLGTQAAHSGSAAAKQSGLPVHLLSARNEQRMGGANVQRLPLKLAGSNSVASSNPSQQQTGVAPSAAFFAGVQQPFPGRAGSTGISRVQSMSAPSRAAAAHGQNPAGQLQNENSRSAPSNLARIMKLADPKGGKASSSGANPSSKAPAPQPAGGPPGAPVAKSEGKENTAGEIIYF
ncbi:uncharacterized protein LOC101851784 [Aplysia californica]|uniref:Uncharacterized protein LOC101851784 n=1 Tax=Aplysia californica TaxID=6500 RepID=A0ABM0JDC6_APLCA|nr:uncharacterized protein LOC101851784 [Aplysia californica]